MSFSATLSHFTAGSSVDENFSVEPQLMKERPPDLLDSIFGTPRPQGVRRTTQKWHWTPPAKVGSVLFVVPYEGVYVAAQRKKIFCVPSKLICRASFCAMTNLIAGNDQAHRA